MGKYRRRPCGSTAEHTASSRRSLERQALADNMQSGYQIVPALCKQPSILFLKQLLLQHPVQAQYILTLSVMAGTGLFRKTTFTFEHLVPAQAQV